MDRPGLEARQAAAQLLAAVVDRHVPADGLTDDLGGNPRYLALGPQDRSLVRAILMAALRHRMAIQTLIDARLDRPLPPKAHALLHVLHIALAQILFLDVPARAAVDLAVEHAGQDPRTRRFAGLVNAVLRGILRQPEEVLREVIDGTPGMPAWLGDRLTAAYGPERAKAIDRAHRLQAAVDFTVRSDPGRWAERLGGIVLPTGTVRVARPEGRIPDLPGFGEGHWWVQDVAAALPARLLGDVRGLNVADLCAAPGGKTAQLALAGARVTAIEISASRIKRLATNLERLGLRASLVKADLLTYAPAEPFDAILLDAPCSSTGTIRRHPDVAFTKTPADIAKLAELQWRMLSHAFTMLKPGGILVYSNCSLDPAEGEDLARRVREEIAQAEPMPLQPGEIDGIEPYLTPEGDLRTTPADLVLDRPELSGMDGFFAARFRLRA